MNPVWQLPMSATFGEKTYQIHGDFRDVLEIFSYLEDPDLPDLLKWRIAVALFYDEPILPEHWEEAARFLEQFLCCGQRGREKPAPKLLDWQQDAPAILADVNKVAGTEIRSLPFLHWWTFLAYFHAIGEGQLSAIVSVRDKLRRGKKLEGWEKDFYRENREKVDLPKRYSREELSERAALNALLDGSGVRKGQVK